MTNIVSRFLIYAIKGYQSCISPSHAPCCKYTPSCSRYTIDAIDRHGAFKGLLLAFWRILRCNPFSKGGYDPVPETLAFGRKRSTKAKRTALERDT